LLVKSQLLMVKSPFVLVKHHFFPIFHQVVVPSRFFPPWRHPAPGPPLDWRPWWLRGGDLPIIGEDMNGTMDS
jgi:hypothetical protein